MEKFRTVKHKKHNRKHGFLARSKSHGGRKVLQRRRAEKRHKLTA